MNYLEFKDLYFPLEQNRYIKASASLNEGEILIIQGPSGSGKSTLLKMLARLIKAHGGRVCFEGIDWKEFSPLEWRTRIHYVPQKPVLFDGSLEDNLKLPFSIKLIKQKHSFSMDEALQYMEQLQLSPRLLNHDARMLSGGEAARATLLRAVLLDPNILLLDEPTAYLDEENRSRVTRILGEWVKQKSRAIILVSHKAEDIKELADMNILSLNLKEGNKNGD